MVPGLENEAVVVVARVGWGGQLWDCGSGSGSWREERKW